MRMSVLASLILLQSDPKFCDESAKWVPMDVPVYRLYLADANNDGFLDLVVQSKDPTGPVNPGGTAKLYLNSGGRKFIEASSPFPSEAKGRNTSVFLLPGDVDNDGQTDFFRACYQEQADHKQFPDTGERSAILRGTGKGFQVVRGSSVDSDGPVTTCAASFLDYDRDGHLDLFVGNWYVRYGTNLLSHPDRLFKGDGKGKFKDVTADAGLMTSATVGKDDSSRPTYGVTVTDVDDDGWPDIITASYGRQANRLWHNERNGTFVDWAARMGVDGDDDRSGVYPEWIKEDPKLRDRRNEPPYRAHGNSFSIVPADFDNDGDIDLFSTEITHNWAGPSSDLTALLVNDGARFRRVTQPFERPRQTKWWNQGDYMAAWADLDNDGLQDLILGSGAYPDDQRLRVYRRRPDRSFEDVTRSWGIDFRDCWQVAVGDIDRDGAVDILCTGMKAKWNGRQKDAIAVWRNTPANHWVELLLEGAPGRSNRDAVGARVWITAGGVTQTREVLSGTGHFGLAVPRVLHVGLAKSATIDSIRIRWPDREGTIQEFKNVPADRFYRLRQGASKLADQ